MHSYILPTTDPTFLFPLPSTSFPRPTKFVASIRHFHICTLSLSAQPQPSHLHMHKTAASPHPLTDHNLRLRNKTLHLPHREDNKMAKSTAQILNFPPPPHSRFRPLLAAILLLCCIPIAFYQLIPSFTHAADDIVASIVSHLHDSPCATDIEPRCCNAVLQIQPCVDECRKMYTDRVTWRETSEFDGCVEECRIGVEGGEGCEV
jgi:hypothetical protein